MPTNDTLIPPFVLGDALGHGGMGAVFRARHRDTDYPAAIKVIRGRGDDASRQTFEREVQAHASLNHPNVVYLFDYGLLPQERPLPDELTPGSPYVAMEFAPHGTIANHAPFQSWAEIHLILSHVLKALSYAHARDVIHRDLKPENLLVFADENRPRSKLTDFGVAFSLRDARRRSADSLAEVSGTPNFMSPEQAYGQWRTFGPWTDIYSLGCIAWNLICHRRPYRADSALGVIMQHTEESIPPLEPAMPLPDGVDAWIYTAMHPDPSHRFQRAADALEALPTPQDTVTTRWLLHQPSPLEAGAPSTQQADPTIPSSAHLDETRPAASDAISPRDPSTDDPEARHPDAVPTLSSPSPSPPEDWRRLTAQHLPDQLLGTGLNLLGLRRLPIEGRAQTRDYLWAALRQAYHDQTLEVLVLRGPAGVGKSRLCQWLLRRAHEEGVAQPLVIADHDSTSSAQEAFPEMIQRHFNAWNLSRAEFHETMIDRLPPLENDAFRDIDAAALTEWVHPTDDDETPEEGPPYRFDSPRQKYALIHRFLKRLHQPRLPLLFIDDLHLHHDALGALEHLLSLSPTTQPPALVIASLRPDLLPPDSGRARRIDALLTEPNCRALDIPPVEPKTHRQIIDRMLPLTPDLAGSIQRRTEGNPLFAHQILSFLVDSERLQHTDRGYTVNTASGPLQLPDDIHAIWRERLDIILQGLSDEQAPQALYTIELAAALGRRVLSHEWEALLADAPLSPPSHLFDILSDRGLLTPQPSGWRFAHGLLVNSLERQAREAGRWQRYHRWIADMLQRRPQPSPSPLAQRRAHHRRLAGQPQRALPLLLEAHRHWLEHGDTDQWKRSLRQHRQLLNQLQVADHHPQRLQNDLHTSNLDFFEGRTDDAFHRLHHLRQRLDPDDTPELTIRTLDHLANFSIETGDLSAADDYLDQATDIAIAHDHPELQAQLAYRRGYLAQQRGDLHTAERAHARAHDLFERTSNTYQGTRNELRRTWIDLHRQRYQSAQQTFQALLARTRRFGFRDLESLALNGLGEAARFRGDLHTAEQAYRNAHQKDIERGRTHPISTLLNLCQVLLAKGQFQDAQPLLRDLRSDIDDLGHQRFDELLDAMEILLACGQRDWPRARQHLHAYREGWPDGAPLWKDHPWLLSRAARCADHADQPTLARPLEELANHLWDRLPSDPIDES